MNWITTNIRLPEDQYMELKLEAARQRKSIASLIRERVARKGQKKKGNASLLSELKALGEEITKENKGVNLTEALIKVRYEK